MKLTVSKTELLRAIEVAGRAVNPKSPLPIYSSLMLETTGPDSLTVTGTDGELVLAATAALESSDVEHGKVAVIAETFVSVVKGLPGPSIVIQQEKTGLVVKSKRSRYVVPILTGESWPVIPKVEDTVSFVVHEKALSVALSRVLPAVGTDSSRQVICGVYWKQDLTTLSLVATDTHRLHVATVPVPQSNGVGSLILGTGSAKELARLLAADDDCQVTTDGSCLKIVGSWGTFISRLIGGNYVAYERFIPQQSGYVEMEQAELEDAIKRASFVAQGSADRLVATITEKGALVLEAASEQYGQAEEELSLTYSSPDYAAHQQFAVSAKNLLGAVAAVPDGIVRVYRAPASRGILVAGENTERFFGVVIPMRLPSDA